MDDCDLDAAKPLRTLVWKAVRTQFAAKDSVQMQKFLGVVREAWTGTSSCRDLRLTEIPNCCRDKRVIPERASSLRVCCFFHVAHVSISPFFIARLARFVARWCEWARKELRHILGFVAHSPEWSLIMKSVDRLGGVEAQHLLRCVVRHEMFQSGRVACRDRRARVQQNQNQPSGDEQPKRCCASEEHWMLVA